MKFLYYDLLAYFRQGFAWLTPIIFFVMVVCLFPLALGPDSDLLKQIAPAMIWIAALLAILISMGKLFQADAQEGFLDLILLSDKSFTVFISNKICSFWIAHCLPLILLTPILGLAFHLDLAQITTLVITLLLGTPTLCLLGAIGAALTVGIRGQGILLPILIMPLYIPTLIFGMSAMIDQSHAHAYFALLAAILLISLAFAPILSSLALKNGVNQ